MDIISSNQERLAEGILNSPLDNNYSNTNRFRPTFNRRCSRLRKFKKPLAEDDNRRLELLMKTVTEEFGIAKPKFSLQLLKENNAPPVHFKKGKPPPTFMFVGRRKSLNQSQSSFRYKSAEKAKMSFSIEGEKCF